MYWYYYDYTEGICYITQTLRISDFAERIGIDPRQVAQSTTRPSLNTGDRYEWIRK